MKDPLEYQYVILDTDGACWTVIDGGTKRIDGLPSLLRTGWRPIRETPYHNAGTAYILILLEREAEPSNGFGFQA